MSNILKELCCFDNFVDDIVITCREFKEDVDDLINDIVIDYRDLKEDIKDEILDSVDGVPIIEDIVGASYVVSDATRTLGITLANPLRNFLGELVEDWQLEKGDHVFAKRGIYTHHGIYAGEGIIIHYNSREFGDYASVYETTVEEFKKWPSLIDIIAETTILYRFNKTLSPLRYSPDKVVERARSKIGEAEYNLIFNNCEHFARWCRCDKNY